METIINLAWFVGIVVGLYFAVKFLHSKFCKNEVKHDLERTMSGLNALSDVKALLLVRGYLLPKELRVAAENWVEEMEEKSKGK